MPSSDQKKSDEIDLFDVLVNTVILAKLNLFKIILLFLLGVAIGTGYFLLSKKVYGNRMIISSTILTTSYTRVLFENANRLLGEGSSAILAAQFKVPEEIINKLNSLAIESVNKAPGEELKDSERFLITVEVTDEKAIPQLQKGIITYLENNDFVKVRVAQRKYFLKQMLTSLEKEIKDLEGLKERITSGSFFQTTKGNVMFDPTSVNSKIVELTEKKINYENDLAISNSVHVIDGFSEFRKESRPRLNFSLAGGAFFGFFLVGLFFTYNGVQKILIIAEQKDAA
jgi:hypothetical protein